MNTHAEPSVDDLRRESERTRATLTSTVDELRGKVEDTASEWKHAVSPSHIKAEVKDYVRESGEHLSQSLRRKVRENPLQAAAIGAGLAYPLWGLLRSVPAPLLLIGAGFWLSQQKRALPGESTVDQVKQKAADFAADAKARAAGAVDRAASAVADKSQQMESAMSDAKAAVSKSVSSVADQVTMAAHDARDKAAGITQRVADTVQTTANSLSAKASDSMAAAKDQMAVAKDKVIEASATSRDAFMEFVDRNPLVVAGAGLAVGAFIAASLPASDTENRLFGEQSDHLKDAARRTASQGIDQARGVASGVISDVTAAAEREGLGAQGLKQAVGDVAEGAKAVADRGMKAALGEATAARKSTQTYES